MSGPQSFQIPSNTLTIRIVFSLHIELNFQFFFSLHSDSISYLHFDTFQVGDNWVVWLICCIFPSLATLPNGFPLTFYSLHNQGRKKHKAAQTEHTAHRGCG